MWTILFSVTLLLGLINADSFSYEDPSRWPEMFPECGGQRQSPIDIITGSAKPGRAIKKLQLLGGDRKPTAIQLENNGHTVKFTFSYGSDTRPVSLIGGPLQSVYLFDHMHLHWGSVDERGSEHLLDGAAFPLETHFVFYNARYGTFENAAESDDGLAVVGTVHSLQAKGKPAKWAKSLSEVRQPGETTQLPDNALFTLDSVVGDLRRPYYSYPGSLTTPPCSETVTWIVRADPQPITTSDLKALRTLIDSDGHPMEDNFRPVQDLNGRTVYRYN